MGPGEDALDVLRRRALEWVNGVGSADAVVDAAGRALLHDLGSEALLSLACLPAGRDRDGDLSVAATIERAVADLGWPFMPRWSPQARRAWLGQQAQDAVDGRISADDFAMFCSTRQRGDQLEPTALAEVEELSIRLWSLSALVEDLPEAVTLAAELHSPEAELLTCAQRIVEEVSTGTSG